jgi:hypothetical protein
MKGKKMKDTKTKEPGVFKKHDTPYVAVTVTASEIKKECPKSKVKMKKTYFAIDTGHYSYDIDFDRCDTVNKIIGWSNQLSQKTWMTTKMLNTFIRLSLNRIGYKIDFNI